MSPPASANSHSPSAKSGGRETLGLSGKETRDFWFSFPEVWGRKLAVSGRKLEVCGRKLRLLFSFPKVWGRRDETLGKEDRSLVRQNGRIYRTVAFWKKVAGRKSRYLPLSGVAHHRCKPCLPSKQKVQPFSQTFCLEDYPQILSSDENLPVKGLLSSENF